MRFEEPSRRLTHWLTYYSPYENTPVASCARAGFLATCLAWPQYAANHHVSSLVHNQSRAQDEKWKCSLLASNPQRYEKLLGAQSVDADSFAAPPGAADNAHSRPGYSRLLSDKPRQLVVGGAVHRRGFHSDFEGVPVPADDFGPAGPRLNVDREDRLRHSSLSSIGITRIWSSSQATRGVMSIIPMGGMTLRSGLMIQSVSR